MKVYVESNFVLELAFRQEQSSSCRALLELGENDRIDLLIPAYSLAEPVETLLRRRKQRRRLKRDLDAELAQMARDESRVQGVDGLAQLTALLIGSVEEEANRLEDIRNRLADVAGVIPLDSANLKSAIRYQNEHDLSPQDAMVYAAVVENLRQFQTGEPSCFLNRNSRDFGDPLIVDELRGYQCNLLYSFDRGVDFVRAGQRE